MQAVEKGRGRMSSLNAIVKTLGLELRGRQLESGRVGPALVLARKRRKVSRRKLARALDLSRDTLVAIEAGGGLITSLEAYAGAVGAGLYLARREDPRPFLTHAGNSSGNPLWETPVGLARALTDAVGGFDLDPCAALRIERQARVKAKVLLTAPMTACRSVAAGQGLRKPSLWQGHWAWVRKCRDEARRGCVVVGLIPARPDSAYWHRPRCRPGGHVHAAWRLKFGDGKSPAPVSFCVVIWGTRRE